MDQRLEIYCARDELAIAVVYRECAGNGEKPQGMSGGNPTKNQTHSDLAVTGNNT